MRALVTGGTRGIGLAVCRLLSERGAQVTALYSSDEAAAERAKALLPAVEFIRADVSNEAQVSAVFSRLETLDWLVNNAGIALWRQVQDTSLSEWERVMAVNAGETEVQAEIEADVEFGSMTRIIRLAGELGAYNTAENPTLISPEEIAPAAPTSLTLPPHSFTVMIFKK